MAEEVKSIATKGNKGFTIRELDLDTKTYLGEGIHFEFLVNTAVTINQTVTNIGADNNPRAMTIRGPVTITGTIKLLGVHIKDFDKIFSVEYDERYGLRVGEPLAPRHFSVSWLVDSLDGSTNKVILYDCIFETPSISSTTDDGASVADYTVSFSAAPVTYPTLAGVDKSITYAIINNVANPDGWAENADNIQYPTEWLVPNQP